MNIKTSIMIALTACIMLVGVAAAYDESGDAGSTWSTEQVTDVCRYSGYSYFSGLLGTNDGADWYYSYWPPSGSWLDLYLDATSYGKCVSAETYNGGKSLMQRIHQKKVNGQYVPDSVTNTHTLSSQPLHVHINGFPGDGAYTFCVYRA